MWKASILLRVKTRGMWVRQSAQAYDVTGWCKNSVLKIIFQCNSKKQMIKLWPEGWVPVKKILSKSGPGSRWGKWEGLCKHRAKSCLCLKFWQFVHCKYFYIIFWFLKNLLLKYISWLLCFGFWFVVVVIVALLASS